MLVNASAVGIYGDRGDEVLTESSAPGSGYLAELCREWEAAAIEAEALGVRVVRPRIGVVLGRGRRRLRKTASWFSNPASAAGSAPDSQWMPWIHLADLRAAIVHAVVSDTLAGAVNCTAPAAGAQPRLHPQARRRPASSGACCRCPDSR